ncbi:MAG TPA: helix-turn-helix transcriptional regulator [Cyclobacteriaceae bacterium]|nr:helix-turn-helix transcriptional regulator [Cyclobacteriaceae bacterium]
MDWILAKIRAVRQSKGISQSQLAEKIGIDLKTYSNWERGRTDLTTRNIDRIAKALEVDPKVIWDPEQFTNPLGSGQPIGQPETPQCDEIQHYTTAHPGPG